MDWFAEIESFDISISFFLLGSVRGEVLTVRRSIKRGSRRGFKVKRTFKENRNEKKKKRTLISQELSDRHIRLEIPSAPGIGFLATIKRENLIGPDMFAPMMLPPRQQIRVTSKTVAIIYASRNTAALFL